MIEWERDTEFWWYCGGSVPSNWTRQDVTHSSEFIVPDRGCVTYKPERASLHKPGYSF